MTDNKRAEGYCPVFHLERCPKNCPRYNFNCDNTLEPCDVEHQIQTGELTERQKNELRAQLSPKHLGEYELRLKEKYSKLLAQRQPSCIGSGLDPEVLDDLHKRSIVEGLNCRD